VQGGAQNLRFKGVTQKYEIHAIDSDKAMNRPVYSFWVCNRRRCYVKSLCGSEVTRQMEWRKNVPHCPTAGDANGQKVKICAVKSDGETTEKHE